MSASLLLIPAAIFYLVVVGALYLYGINFYYLTYLAVKKNHELRLPLPTMTEWPKVTIQLPIYNEMYVAQRLIEAAAAVDYPSDRLEIQVLDDSTDETVELAAETVTRLRAQGANVVHLHRANREGFKAGALRDGLKQARGEFIAIFDADFIPTADFLKETIPHFQEKGIAFVQARWGHANRDYSLLTYFQSLSIDAHFMIEQYSRSRGGYWFNFNGTAGVWRKSAIEDAGGWQPRTLTEDLDLSYRAFLNGWRAVYLRELAVPAEIPVTFTAYRRQQHRWARGSMENALILLPQIWRSQELLRIKLESTFHLTGYFVHLLLFALCLIYPLVVTLSFQFPTLVSLFGIALFFNITAFAPTLFFVVAQYQLKRPWWQMVPAFLFISAFGGGMMLNTVRAAWEVLRRKTKQFERTPKHGITKKGQPWKFNRYQLKLDKIVFAEILLALVNVFSSVMAFRYHHWFISFYTLLFAVGLFFTSLYTIAQSLYAAQKA